MKYKYIGTKFPEHTGKILESKNRFLGDMLILTVPNKLTMLDDGKEWGVSIVATKDEVEKVED